MYATSTLPHALGLRRWPLLLDGIGRSRLQSCTWVRMGFAFFSLGFVPSTFSRRSILPVALDAGVTPHRYFVVRRLRRAVTCCGRTEAPDDAALDALRTVSLKTNEPKAYYFTRLLYFACTFNNELFARMTTE